MKNSQQKWQERRHQFEESRDDPYALDQHRIQQNLFFFHFLIVCIRHSCHVKEMREIWKQSQCYWTGNIEMFFSNALYNTLFIESQGSKDVGLSLWDSTSPNKSWINVYKEIGDKISSRMKCKQGSIINWDCLLTIAEKWDGFKAIKRSTKLTMELQLEKVVKKLTRPFTRSGF